MPQKIDGNKIAAEIRDELKLEVEAMNARGVHVCLAVVQVGTDAASSVYVRGKQKDCAYIGIESCSYALAEETTETELLALIERLNRDSHVHGILVQLPLPAHIDEKKVVRAIHPEKDVDGFHPVNIGRLCIGEECFKSCTPAGVIELLKRSGIELAGRECVVIGRSANVGKPAALLLLEEHATVTIAHSHTADLKELVQRADIVVAAVGKPKFITKEYLKEGAVVVDIGIHRQADNTLCGDVDYQDVLDKVSAITPVPGGVGPMTRAMLMHNCVLAARKQGGI